MILNHINSYGNGLYCWIRPTAQSLLRIYDMLGTTSDVKISDYHSTIMYSKVNGEPGKISDPLAPIVAQAVAIEQWTDHKDRPLLVLTLKSRVMDMYHNLLTSMGYVHSYPQYTPHITLAYMMAPQLQRSFSPDTVISFLPSLQYSPLQ